MPAPTVLAAAIDLSRHIRPGDTVLWGQGQAEPRSLVQALIEQRHRLQRIRVFLGVTQSGQLSPEHADAIDFIAYCGSGGNRVLADAGVLDILPCYYGHLPRLMRSRQLPVDVVFLQVSPPDAQGRYSFGLAMDYLPAAIAGARTVIAEVNPEVPWTHGEFYLRREDFHALVEAAYPVGGSAQGYEVRPHEAIIARHVAHLIEDGATLQVGLGTLPNAVLDALHQHRDLGLHSGMVGDGLTGLAAAGALTHARKSIDPGIGVVGLLMGSDRLHRYAAGNATLQLRGTDYTHHPDVLGQIAHFAAINSAVEVDLTGQINAEVAAGGYVGAVGGAPAFLQAAQVSPGGVPVIALPATAGAHSRIVSELSGPVSTARCDAGIVVTEYGVADLRGKTLSGRLRAMLDVAAPQHRERLALESHEKLRRAGVDWTQMLGS